MPEPHDTAPEIWRPIPSTNGLYDASSWGRIRSVEKEIFAAGALIDVIPAKIIKQRPNGVTGYPTVAVRGALRTKPRTCSAHTLIAEAFHGPRPHRHDVNHIDGTRDNNRPDNLEYITRSDNHLHAYRTLGRKPSRRNWKAKKLSDEQVQAIRSRYATGSISQAALAKEYGVGSSHVCNIVTGQRRKLLS